MGKSKRKKDKRSAFRDILQGICKFTAAGFAKIFIAQYAASGGNVAKLIFMDLVLVRTHKLRFS